MRDDFSDNAFAESAPSIPFTGGFSDDLSCDDALRLHRPSSDDHTSDLTDGAPDAAAGSYGTPTAVETTPAAGFSEALSPAIAEAVAAPPPPPPDADAAVSFEPLSEPVFRPLWVVRHGTPLAVPTLADEAGVLTTTFAPPPPSWKSWVREGLSIGRDVALALIIALLIGLFVIQPVYVKGTSMLPRLREGERLFVNRFIYNFSRIERGDIVVFYYPKNPHESFIKRVIGLPGDEVTLANGKLYINGKLVPEAYLSSDYTTIVSPPRTWVVEPHHYFVMGDNRDASNDSRNWGLVPEMYIYGKAVYRYWPLSEMGFIGDEESVLAPLRALQSAEPQRELPAVE